MRELKFRAWDRVEKQFRYFIVGEFGTLYNCEDLQQFTGLNDADGKEIYEGDILRGEYYNCHVDYTKGIGVVHMGIVADTDGYEDFGSRRNQLVTPAPPLEDAKRIFKVIRTGVDHLWLTGGGPLMIRSYWSCCPMRGMS